jgi:hypothetical protein
MEMDLSKAVVVEFLFAPHQKSFSSGEFIFMSQNKKEWIVFVVVLFSFSLTWGAMNSYRKELPPPQAGLLAKYEEMRIASEQTLAPSPINPPFGDSAEWVVHDLHFVERKEIGDRVFLVSYGKDKDGYPAMGIKEITPFWTRVKIWFKTGAW